MSRAFDYAMELKKNGNAKDAKAYFEKAAQGGEPEAYMELARLAVPEAGEHYYNYSKLDVTLLPQPCQVCRTAPYPSDHASMRTGVQDLRTGNIIRPQRL